MSIFRTNNPLQYDEVDGIVIDEQAPAPAVQGVGTGIAILVGQFQRGGHALSRVGGLKDFHAKYGKSNYLGNLQLKNKAFSVLKIVRVEATGSAKASLSIDSAAGAVVITDNNSGASEFYPVETYASPADVVGKSKLVDAVITDGDLIVTAKDKGVYGNSITVKVGVASAASLTGGLDGTVSDTDYENAIQKCIVEGAGNVLFLDQYTQTRNLLLKSHAAETQDKMVIVSHEEDDSLEDVLTASVALRDTAGRIIFAHNWVETLVDGVGKFTSPASWLASIISQTAPSVDPAFYGNKTFLSGAISLKSAYSRDQYIQLKEAGVASFENDSDVGIKLKSGIVTQIADSSKLTILRRRMADYLTNSVGKFLKLYQNDVNSKDKRIAVKSAIANFDKQQELLGILPDDSEVTGGGKAKLIDIESENTNESIAAGKFIIIYKRRIYSSMRFIVLKAEIGESVVVTEQG